MWYITAVLLMVVLTTIVIRKSLFRSRTGDGYRYPSRRARPQLVAADEPQMGFPIEPGVNAFPKSLRLQNFSGAEVAGFRAKAAAQPLDVPEIEFVGDVQNHASPAADSVEFRD